jgi:hypothetical protein
LGREVEAALQLAARRPNRRLLRASIRAVNEVRPRGRVLLFGLTSTNIAVDRSVCRQWWNHEADNVSRQSK